MTGIYRGANGVQKLLKIARTDADTMRDDLQDIDRAKASARAALAEIADSVAREVGATGDQVAFAAYADSLRERRVNLKKTLNSLEAAGEEAQEKLSGALGEIAKLERLAEINARDALVRDGRSEEGEADQATPDRQAVS